MTWSTRYESALMGTFGVPARTLVRGEGLYVWDDEGRRYLDFLAGIAVNALGHAHPRVVETVARQAGQLMHVSNFFSTPPQIELAEFLVQKSNMGDDARVFFCNSGAEANETAFKIARRTGHLRVLAAEGAFHGRTMGSLSLTHKAAYREPFDPLVPGVEHVAFGDIDALRRALKPGSTDAASGAAVSAFMAEPVQGEAGIISPPHGYLTEAIEAAHSADALVIWDEIQTGMGRTGTWFAHQNPALASSAAVPDVMTLAKGLGGGIPIGAVIARGAAAGFLSPGQHGTTYGGNPLAASVALEVGRTIEDDHLLANADHQGKAIVEAITSWQHPLVKDVRGLGLLRAVELNRDCAARVYQRCLDLGLIVNAVAPNAVRLAPPLIMQDEHLREFLPIFRQALDDALNSDED